MFGGKWGVEGVRNGEEVKLIVGLFHALALEHGHDLAIIRRMRTVIRALEAELPP